MLRSRYRAPNSGDGMHEYSLVSSLMDEIDRQAGAHRATSVQKVHVRLGEMAGVDADLFRTAFEMIQPHTICAEAELVLHSEPAGWACPLCGRRHPLGATLRCEACDVPLRPDGGRDLVLERLEMEVSHV